MLTAGAGGASGACFNCDATNWAEGGRWRRSRHLRRVQRPRQGGMEMISFPYRNRFKFPFLSDLFSENRNGFCPKSVQKVRCKKWHKQTHTQTESSRSGAAPGSCFGQPERRYRSQMAQNPVPKTTSESQLRSRLKSTSGLPRSLHSPQVAPAAQLKKNSRISVL